ncbi:polyketide synthase, partial [Pleurocapsa sp. CCALA 161]|uniref:beta-ketoacyl synthase N-terminal-like domain-containing protein n=1 Tax=Pleurocapsa sp. CCALA 161 TaxID=2107688 RepID=UPI000D3F0AFD
MKRSNQNNLNFSSQKLSIIEGKALQQVPNAPKCLLEILQRAALTNKELVYVQPSGEEKTQSYQDLLLEAQQILAGLRKLGLNLGDKVILQINHAQDFIPAFWGCILGGFVPVPISIAPTYTQQNNTVQKLHNAWQMLEQPVILTNIELAAQICSLSKLLHLDNWQVETVEGLKDNQPDLQIHQSQPDDLAVLLLTSGSTGMPKGVMLSHRNLLSMSRGTVQMNGFDSSSVTLNWMPLDHVGAISFLGIMAVDLGCQQIHVPTNLILKNPLRWLDLIERHRATISWAPNFAFSLINERLREIQQSNWDLSSMVFLVNAGEQIVAKTARKFLKLLGQHGLASTAIHPAFGMSETCSGITWSDGFSLETISDDTSFVELGQPIPGASLRIVDENNQILTKGLIGKLQFKGASVTSGYYQNPEYNRKSFTEGGWFETGDLGYLDDDGRLVITGRNKDNIIINGINYYSHEIESVIEEIEEIDISYTAACAVKKTDSQGDQLAIFLSTSITEQDSLQQLLKQVRKTVVSKVGINPRYIIPVSKENIPKTAIGKIQRSQLSKRFEAGEFDSIIASIKSSNKASGSIILKTETEAQITQIWQELLGLEEVGLKDNFFELGGHSLLLVQAQAELEQRFDKQISVADMFIHSNVEALAKYLSEDRSKEGTPPEGQQRAKIRQQQRGASGQVEIAVIGMSCRFPGADNIEQFWQNLQNGVSSISFFSEEDIRESGIDPKVLQNPNYVMASPIISNTEHFDANFFGCSAKEAELMDPQQRLMLECAWESLEDAGYNPLTYSGAIGIYAGASMNTYLLNNIYPNRHRLDSHDDLRQISLDSMGGFQMMVDNDKDYLTTKVSYKLNLRGPSVNVQTACSTSLVAIDIASKSLLNGECDMCLAGGVSVQVPQKSGHLYQEGMIVSPDGYCRAFDAAAQGTIFGSGGGLVVLKRLEDALRDRDRVYAVIKGSAINNDGGMKVGYAAPQGEGQASAVSEAITIAGIDPETIDYVEAHGTGTILGDPVEVGALTKAFQGWTNKKQYCGIGSVKSNVGHLQIASGVAGFIKTVLALHKKRLPQSLHYEKPNPKIEFANSPFYVCKTLSEWKSNGSLRRAGVNSLGIGGTNAHVILEEAPEQVVESQKSEPKSS